MGTLTAVKTVSAYSVLFMKSALRPASSCRSDSIFCCFDSSVMSTLRRSLLSSVKSSRKAPK